jgi:hypothetical protein
MEPELAALHEELERVDMTWRELLVLALEAGGPETGAPGFMNALGFDVHLAVSVLRQLPDRAGPSAFQNRVSFGPTLPPVPSLPADASVSESRLRRV